MRSRSFSTEGRICISLLLPSLNKERLDINSFLSVEVFCLATDELLVRVLIGETHSSVCRVNIESLQLGFRVGRDFKFFDSFWFSLTASWWLEQISKRMSIQLRKPHRSSTFHHRLTPNTQRLPGVHCLFTGNVNDRGQRFFEHQR